ncbi:MAG: formylglycine-generating enzyme family protein [Desulfobacterales bacterium]|nr:formylglycine-generating enzyme family protein [Desulfobacterales bacterium]
MKFVYIEPGEFMMGSPSNEPGRDSDDETQHKVRITRGFYMQQTQVTQAQWKKIMGKNPSYFQNAGDNAPVETISWVDCKEFIEKLNQMEGGNFYRLPTEAEWEFACRAGTTTPFSFGKCLSTEDANYDGNYPLGNCPKGIYREKPLPVASFSPNKWGLYDMHGNVWEWCLDIYASDIDKKGVVDNPISRRTICKRRQYSN